MNRKIKFRAWDKENKMMLEVYGFNRHEVFHEEVDWSNARNQEVPLRTQSSLMDVELMEWTGLKDKNGKEIYEGDILKEINDPMVVKVEWNDGAYWFCYNERNRWTRDWIRTQIDDKWEWEVIGNIYENTELLTLENSI